ncbi:MAG: hypothetical protein GXX83_00420 [Gaiellales bacterium]|nr:hypothetical protein [Gaiellales bacterium]
MRIGVDIDGVLADHVRGILPRIEAKYGLRLNYEDLSAWRYAVGESDMLLEIMEAMEDPEWVTALPVYEGVAQGLAGLRELGRVSIVTARPEGAVQATLAWLEGNQLAFDEFIRCENADKPAQAIDVLVDDHLPNVCDFVVRGNGVGVLLDRPWNREGREGMAEPLGGGRLRVVKGVGETVALLGAAQLHGHGLRFS